MLGKKVQYALAFYLLCQWISRWMKFTDPLGSYVYFACPCLVWLYISYIIMWIWNHLEFCFCFLFTYSVAHFEWNRLAPSFATERKIIFHENDHRKKMLLQLEHACELSGSLVNAVKLRLQFCMSSKKLKKLQTQFPSSAHVMQLVLRHSVWRLQGIVWAWTIFLKCFCHSQDTLCIRNISFGCLHLEFWKRWL